MKKQHFLKAIDTLKLYRRAELLDQYGNDLIESLYVDPLPEEHTLNTILKPNTTFIIGRKGTGKSTIFQRAQRSIDNSKDRTWAYIDIKSLYESSTAQIIVNLDQTNKNTLSNESIRKLLIFKSFFVELVDSIKNQIFQRITNSTWEMTKEAFTGNATQLFESLDELLSDLKEETYSDITSIIAQDKSDETKINLANKTSGNSKVELSKTPSISTGNASELSSEFETSHNSKYSNLFVRILPIRDTIIKLKSVLKILNIKHLYIFIDDFSELPKQDMQEVVDTVLAPFNNWSDEFIKLKVAVYPGRVYSGGIDLSKVDEIYLDTYRAFGRVDVSKMESSAIDFTRRLVAGRIETICNESIETYFDSNSDDFWRSIFYACHGNPRILGYILYFSYEFATIYDKKIGLSTIQDSAKRYYEEKVYNYFKLNKFLQETFEEKSSIYSLKELYEQIVNRAKSLKAYNSSIVIQEMKGKHPTSHFYIKSNYDSLLNTLELNFFITKYYEQRDRNGDEVSIYALNYGLCQQQNINYGRPKSKREHRLYFVERIFDYTPILVSYMRINQEIVCESCGQQHGTDMLEAIKSFDMLCPACKVSICKIVNLSRKYEDLIQSVSKDLLLPATDLGILKTLHDNRKAMFAKDLAEELDVSYQLVGKRGKYLDDQALLERKEDNGRRIFEITKKAEQEYFTESFSDPLDLD